MFEIYKSKSGKQFYFRLKAKNHQTILTSEGYNSRQACQSGITSVQKNCTKQSCYEVKTAKNGKHCFNLLAGNKQVIGSSQMYASPATMRKGIASVMKNARSKTVKDLT